MARHTIHVISHTHWDREWYLPFEKHRRRLVALFDGLLDLLDRDPDFAHFHADGQIIPLEDYLEIRPHRAAAIRRAAAEKRLSIGPWYVLQDEFLTSGEANVRNLMLGLRRAQAFGQPLRLGYLPDSFGNIGQMPQILRGFDIDNAVFGRGINRWQEDHPGPPEAQGYKSELTWRAPDGSEVLGIFMANWYANAMSIPTDPDEVLPYVEKTRDACLRYATTSQLLFMNGCDHTPSQPDISTAIRRANEKLPDDILVHSNFADYIAAVQAEVQDLQVKEGEMRSQYTDGWSTLTNVLSSRIYQKQANWRAQTLLEKAVEPLAATAWDQGADWDGDLIWYCWKILLQNHPHDSICGCSVDEVHREMDVRFEKCEVLAKQLAAESLAYIAARCDTSTYAENAAGALVYNPINTHRHEIVEAQVDFPEDATIENLAVLNSAGQPVPCHIIADEGIAWDYQLPEIGFRIPYSVRRFRLAWSAQVPPTGYAAYQIVPTAPAPSQPTTATLENQYLRVQIHPDGRFDLVDKTTGNRFDNLHQLQDSLDVGDEYNYRAPTDDQICTPAPTATHIGPITDNGLWAQCSIETSLSVRGHLLPITYTLKLAAHTRRLEVALQVENHSENHRLRVLFPTDLNADFASADGQFDVVQRPIEPTSVWQNPSNCHPQQAFVDISDNHQGLTIANRGLPEYEILRDGRNTIALTLLRSVGELGDWGTFPTPQAQCKGTYTLEYALIPHANPLAASNAAVEARCFNAPLHTSPLAKQAGTLPLDFSFLHLEPANIVLSTIKKAEADNSLIVRFYNPYNHSQTTTLSAHRPIAQAFNANLNEDPLDPLACTDGRITLEVAPKKIITCKLHLTP